MAVKQKWFSGPPPSVGWWPASPNRAMFGERYRWWDGSGWSSYAMKSSTPREAAAAAKTPNKSSLPIEWQHRPASWPDRSRT